MPEPQGAKNLRSYAKAITQSSTPDEVDAAFDRYYAEQARLRRRVFLAYFLTFSAASIVLTCIDWPGPLFGLAYAFLAGIVFYDHFAKGPS